MVVGACLFTASNLRGVSEFPHPRNPLSSETTVIVGNTVIQVVLGRRNAL